ncbi:MAG TPA: 3-dehydroquinate synthase [Gemmatimonadaceae bacterium]
MVAPSTRTSAPRSIDVIGYQVSVGAGVLDTLGAVCQRVAPAYRYAVISDDQVARHWMAPATAAISRVIPRAAVCSTAIPAGESSKTRDTWARLTDWLLSEGAGRDTAVIALGGGVVGDLAGFVAATYLRGVPVIQVPTSLLAMVDASIGGKTGVDTPSGKNLVGAFHQPAAVLVDPATLATLPAAHLRAGVAEVLKHGAIADAAYFQMAASWAAQLHRATQHESARFDWAGSETLEIITRSVATKAEVVRADPLERGRRQVLNTGHTVAHAVERETGYAVLHGEAVSIGLVTEALLGELAGITQAGTADVLRSALGSAGLPTRVPAGVEPGRLLEAMRVDKKSRRGGLAFALLKQIGVPAGSDAEGWSTRLEESVVLDALRTATSD